MIPGQVVASVGLAYVRSLFYVDVLTGWDMLRVGGQQLAPLVHSVPGRALLSIQGSDVEFVRGSITPEQLFSARPSYVNAVSIQSREGDAASPCQDCYRLLRPFHGAATFRCI
jgi:hypothetical protein